MNIFENNKSKTYATQSYAIKAVEKKHPHLLTEHRWLVATNKEGRFFVVFIGQTAVEASLHFHYCVAA